ncbi:MAG TPA: hypothetical protein PKO42_06995, partial [Tenuifilaceae bacterium]|nr:hypothetical protein [Tenuifilaceae bacterium]
MNRLFKYFTFLILAIPTGLPRMAAAMVNKATPDTLQINGNLNTVRSLITSREFSAAAMLTKEALSNSRKINYIKG